MSNKSKSILLSTLSIVAFTFVLLTAIWSFNRSKWASALSLVLICAPLSLYINARKYADDKTKIFVNFITPIIMFLILSSMIALFVVVLLYM